MRRHPHLEKIRLIGDENGAMLRCTFSQHCTFTEWARDASVLLDLAVEHLEHDHGVTVVAA